MAMKNSRPIVYMDACCFIDVVKQEVGILPTDRTDDAWHVKKLLEAHLAGDVMVMTSMLSLAECVALEHRQTDVPPEVQDLFRRFLTSGKFLVLAPQTPRTGRIAQDLRWKHKVVLKGADALHVATAIEISAFEFISTDDRLRRPNMVQVADQLGGAKGLRFIRAAHTRLVPDRFRQGNFADV